MDLSGLFRLDGRVAVVTGASSGFGDRFARVLHDAGATVVVAARRRDRLDALAADLGERVVAVTADVTVDADCEALVAAAIARCGRIDVLVNNAGRGEPMPAEDEPMDHWRAMIDLNLNSLFLLSQLAGRQMLAQGSGSIVNIASVMGLVGSAPVKQASYCAAKGGVVNLTRELACQWARRGVRVNAIAPGWFPTELTAEMVVDERSNDYVAKNCPMGRYGDVVEVDGALLYLASDASTYTTGQVIAVDGGWTAR
jgi:NAD(P)-dependent dehydrogenase (short-subunit alcohol dehydrogenase family)